ncbi:T9SS type A sorting domain-containing protein, partial [bacterium]|nr:T9SS type A sorting domain-containing protein [bacterium]
PSNAQLFAAYPNPFNPSTQFSVKLKRGGEVGVDIFDLNGRRVDSIAKIHMDAGDHRIDWKPEGLPSGVYMARLSRDGKLLSSQKLVLTK